MEQSDNCPHCGVSLLSSPIEIEIQKYYGEETHFRREIGIEIREIYDGALYWMCPDCRGKWHRWPENTREYELARRYVE